MTACHAGGQLTAKDTNRIFIDVRYYGTVTIMTNTRYGMFFGKVK